MNIESYERRGYKNGMNPLSKKSSQICSIFDKKIFIFF